MKKINFETTPRIICHTGASAELGTLVGSMGVRHVFLVTDEGLLKTGIAETAVAALKAASIKVTLYSDVKADPPEVTILEAVDRARAAGVDGVVGLGGGSSLDTAKLVALLVKTPQEISGIYGVGLAKGPRLPLIQMPTTSGTGSEVTPISVVTTPTEEKKPVVSPLLLPDIAVLDANLTLGLPPAVTAATGIDALVHAIEALSTHLKGNPLSEVLALKAAKMICENLEEAVTNGSNLEAREQMLLASLLAGMAFSNASVGAVHAFAYPLGIRFHVPHGLSNSLMLPHILRFNQDAGQAVYAQLGRAILPDMADASDKLAAGTFIDVVCALVQKMPYAQKLREVGVAPADIPVLAADVMKIQRLLDHNPRPILLGDATALYEQAL